MGSLGLAIAEICSAHGISDAVISPGSRSAPLTVGFARNNKISCHVVIDERSAGYIALGIAQQTQSTVALVCTSGTATLNYMPAIAEAFYQKIPLLVITADRPPEWIGQQDGQAVQQQNVFGKHCKQYYQLPCDTENKDAQWHFFRSVNEAINLTQHGSKGPVHLNVPFREPFYQEIHRTPQITLPRIIVEHPAIEPLADEVKEQFHYKLLSAKRVVLLIGQHRYNTIIREQLALLAGLRKIVIVSDLLSNTHGIDYINANIDSLITNEAYKSENKIDMLITFGDSLLSKHLKNYFRKCNVNEHWHIQANGSVADTFQSLTNIIRAKPAEVLDVIYNAVSSKDEDSHKLDKAFYQQWQQLNSHSTALLNDFMQQSKSSKSNTYNEFSAIFSVLNHLPNNCVLHLSNSMTVRYANIIGLQNSNIEVYSNRGTSGIDGCMSTAVGHAIAKRNKHHILIIGDLAFFYDRNALWHKNGVPKNLTIILMNNNGGGIFKLIDGPNKLNEVDEFFVTSHHQTAENTAKDMKLSYCRIEDKDALQDKLNALASNKNSAQLIEVITNMEINTQFFEEYKLRIKNHNASEAR